MKKVLALVAFAGFLTFGVSTAVFAVQTDSVPATDTAAPALTNVADPVAQTSVEDDSTKTANDGGYSLTTQLKIRFIEGGAGFMGIVLLCLILGLALAIERIVYLNLATTNTKKLLNSIENALASGGVEAAKDVCRNTRGPVASIFYQGLDRSDEGVEMVEKSIVSYGGVQMSLMEKVIP